MTQAIPQAATGPAKAGRKGRFGACHGHAFTALIPLLSPETLDIIAGTRWSEGKTGYLNTNPAKRKPVLQSLLIKTATAGLLGEAVVYAAAFMAVILHYAAAARGGYVPVSLRAFGRHLLPYDLLISRWTRLDIAVYALNKSMLAFVIPSVATMAVLASQIVQTPLGFAFGTTPIVSLSIASLAVFLICALLIRDFASFYVHLMQHRIPMLWEFHKVHHAPESLIPLTSHRLHPLDQFVGMAAEAPLLGMLVGFYAWLTHAEASHLILLSVGFYTLINLITFSPLRHSHIDLRLGPLERVLLSPAHHQLHHSIEAAHRDKNFGAIFPFWDRLFHTLAGPPRTATYRLGLADGKSGDYSTLPGCYLAPFANIRDGLQATGIHQMLRVGPIANARELGSMTAL
jgi:sterol desaturase/sphingolipid hydroxylase (fatty acid hydroxylase superfamily)